MDADECARLVMFAKVTWPKLNVDEVTLSGWMEYLEPFPYAAAKEAVKQMGMAQADDRYATPPSPAHIAAKLKPRPQGVDGVIAICDRWYTSTDDVTRHPTRDERQQFPLAAKVWQLAGGYDALHDKEWAHQRLRKAYEEALYATQQYEQQTAIAGATTDDELRRMLDDLGNGKELE